MEGEEDETISPLCTCGQFHSNNESSSKASAVAAGLAGETARKTPTWLESSFVHLMVPRKPLHISPSPPNKHSYYSQHGFLEQHQHLEQLLQATTTTTSSSAEISLCSDCTDRVAAALESDTQRLYAEVNAYKDTVSEARQRTKTFEAMSNVNLPQALSAYQDEISILRQEVQAREEELAHLNSLLKEQVEMTNELGSFANRIQEDQNALELQSKSFDDSAKLLSKTLATVQTEVDQLSLVRLPLSLFDLQVDERGLRYPLINQLRLAFRPKGDASDSEIRAAWSQATQLLLILGTLLKYPSSEWKLVPLADCAKLIYRKEIFNLKPGDCRSLMALNALLDQVIRHAKTIFAAQQNQAKIEVKSPPFPSSPSSIGNTELARLDRTDHVGWSHVIHRMASNLLWLSERVSELVALQVSTLTHSVV
jgi:hypothetical protein